MFSKFCNTIMEEETLNLIQSSVSRDLAIKSFVGYKLSLVNINNGSGIDTKQGGNLYYIEIQGNII